MNRYLFFRALWLPGFLVLFGVLAMLDQWHVLRMGRSWPLFVILFGLLRLAEAVVLTVAPPPPPGAGAWGSPAGATVVPPPTPGLQGRM